LLMRFAKAACAASVQSSDKKAAASLSLSYMPGLYF
jgi:hypothetical protein